MSNREPGWVCETTRLSLEGPRPSAEMFLVPAPLAPRVSPDGLKLSPSVRWLKRRDPSIAPCQPKTSRAAWPASKHCNAPSHRWSYGLSLISEELPYIQIAAKTHAKRNNRILGERLQQVFLGWMQRPHYVKCSGTEAEIYVVAQTELGLMALHSDTLGSISEDRKPRRDLPTAYAIHPCSAPVILFSPLVYNRIFAPSRLRREPFNFLLLGAVESGPDVLQCAARVDQSLLLRTRLMIRALGRSM